MRTREGDERGPKDGRTENPDHKELGATEAKAWHQGGLGETQKKC